MGDLVDRFLYSFGTWFIRGFSGTIAAFVAVASFYVMYVIAIYATSTTEQRFEWEVQRQVQFEKWRDNRFNVHDEARKRILEERMNEVRP